MRYYNFALYASADQIKEKTTINLREYDYENTIAAVNNYMYKRLDIDVLLFAYWAEYIALENKFREVDRKELD